MAQRPNPDKTWVFTCEKRGLLVYSLDNKQTAKFDRKLDEECKLFEQSGDCQLLAYVNSKGVHFVETSSLKPVRSLPFERVQGIRFSPKSTYLAVFTAYLCNPNEQPPPNLFIVKVADGKTVHSYVQKRQTSWEPHWFADESYLARSFANTIMFYEPTDLSKHVKQLNVERVAEVCLSPCNNKKYIAVYVPPSAKGQPAFCRVYNIDQPGDTIASKSFFKCDSVTFKWNGRGTDLLILATNEVDKSNASYYGDQALHYANVKGDSCMVQLKKKGPIYHTEWSDTTFCVVYGYMPARATVFNLKCDPVWDLGEEARNLAVFNPHGNILLTAGFGNLSGTVETWDVEQQKRISTVQIADTTHLEFASDGVHFLTATLSPRLRVNNGFKVWHYTGALKTELVALKEGGEGFYEVWQARLQQLPKSPTKPDIVYKRVEGIAQSAPKASKQAYKPPNVRAMEESQKQQDNKNKKKKKPKAPAEKAVPATPVVDPAIAKLDEDDRRARAIKKKLSQIYVLKQRLAEGEALEPEQMEKVSKEKELAEELKQLEL